MALVFSMAVPCGYSIYTTIWFGVLSGKNSTLVLCVPNDIPNAMNTRIKRTNVIEEYQYTLFFLTACCNLLSYQFSNFTRVFLWNLSADFLMTYLYNQKRTAFVIISVPNPLYPPSKINGKIPKPTNMTVSLINCFLVNSFLPIVMN